MSDQADGGDVRKLESVRAQLQQTRGNALFAEPLLNGIRDAEGGRGHPDMCHAAHFNTARLMDMAAHYEDLKART